MPKSPAANPFAVKREPRSVTITFRMTPTEHNAVVEIVGKKRSAIVEFIRHGLSLAIDEHLKERKR